MHFPQLKPYDGKLVAKENVERFFDYVTAFMCNGGAKDLFEAGIRRAIPSTAKPIQRRLEQTTQVHCHRAMMSQLSARVAVPKSVLANCPQMQTLVQEMQVIMTNWSVQLPKEAAAWADRMLDERPEWVCDLFRTSTGWETYELVSIAPFAGNTAKQDASLASMKKATNKVIASAVGQLQHAYDAMAAANEGEEQFKLLLADTLYGGVRLALQQSLIRMYQVFFLYVLTLQHPADVDLPSVFENKTPYLDPEFYKLVGEHSKFLDLFTIAGPVIREGAVQQALGLPRGIAPYQTLMLDLSAALDKSCRATGKATKQIEVGESEIRRLQQVLKDKQTAVAAQIESSNEYKRLQAEHEALKKRFEKLQQENNQQANRLEKLLRTPSPIIVPPTMASAPAAPALTAPVPAAPDTDPWASLQGMRGVLLGGHTIFHNKLNPLLPGWTFYHPDAAQVDDAALRSAEVVVIFHNYCNHRLSESAMKKLRQYGTPVVYATKVNPGAFCHEVIQKLKDMAVLH